MRKWIATLLVAFLALGVVGADVPPTDQGILENLDYEKEFDVPPAPTNELPHYFKVVGLEPYADPAVRAKLSGRERGSIIYDMIQSSIYYTQRNVLKWLDHPVTRKWNIDGEPVLVVFPDYEFFVKGTIKKGSEVEKEFWARSEEGAQQTFKKYQAANSDATLELQPIYYYRNPLGYEELTEAEFQAVEWDIYSDIYQSKTGLDIDFGELPDKALEITASYLGITKNDLKEQMDLVVEESNGLAITLADVMNLPQPERDSFLPEVVIFGPLAGAWGMTYLLNYALPSVIYYSTQARLYDWLMTDSLVLKHEFVHSNSMLQSSPLGWYFDVELWAALVTDLHPDSPLNLLYHGYLAPVRTFIYGMFGWDPEKRRREVWKLSSGGYIYPDVAEWEKLEEETKAIANELRWATLNILYPVFYADPVLWNSIATRFCNQHTIFFAILSEVYVSTVLSDPNGELTRAQYTAKWIETNKDIIREVRDAALDEAGEEKETEEEIAAPYRRLSWCPLAGDAGLPSDIRREIEFRLAQGESLREIILSLAEETGLGKVLGWGGGR